MKRWLALVGIGFAMVAASTWASQPLESVMRRKLDHFQQVLAGLVEQDFASIEREAFALIRITQAAEWSALRTTEYRRHSQLFQADLEALMKAANGRNLDRATRAYQDAVSQCIQCHTHVREVRNASAGAGSLGTAARLWPGRAASPPPGDATRVPQ